jgi:hypothetical protein
MSSEREKAEKERSKIKEYTEENKIKKGDVWYPIDYRWFKSWKDYTLFDVKEGQELDWSRNGARPLEIDNTDLQDSDNPVKLKPGLQEHYHFELVHSSVWEKLQGWYGGGPAFPRNVIARGTLGMVRLTFLHFRILFSQTQKKFSSPVRFPLLSLIFLHLIFQNNFKFCFFCLLLDVHTNSFQTQNFSSPVRFPLLSLIFLHLILSFWKMIFLKFCFFCLLLDFQTQNFSSLVRFPPLSFTFALILSLEKMFFLLSSPVRLIRNTSFSRLIPTTLIHFCVDFVLEFSF